MLGISQDRYLIRVRYLSCEVDSESHTAETTSIFCSLFGCVFVSIKVTCNACGKKLKAKGESAGKKVKCPGCGDILIIPEAVYDAVEDEFDDYGDDTFDDDTYGEDPFASDDIDSYGSEISVPAKGRKPCPMCGEMIQAGASKCRFCGEIFDPKLKKKAKAAGADADMTGGDWAVAIICSGIGCIAGIVWLIQGKPKGGKMLGVSLAMGILWNVINVIIQSAAQ